MNSNRLTAFSVHLCLLFRVNKASVKICCTPSPAPRPTHTAFKWLIIAVTVIKCVESIIIDTQKNRFLIWSSYHYYDFMIAIIIITRKSPFTYHLLNISCSVCDHERTKNMNFLWDFRKKYNHILSRVRSYHQNRLDFITFHLKWLQWSEKENWISFNITNKFREVRSVNLSTDLRHYCIFCVRVELLPSKHVI